MIKARTFKDFLTTISKEDAVALVDAKSGAELTYKELLEKAKDLSSRLLINPGDRVVLYELSQLDWVISFFAIQLRSGIAVPIDERVDPAFIQKVLKKTDPLLILTEKFDHEVLAGYRSMTCKDLLSRPVVYQDVSISKPDDPCQIIFTSGTWSDPKGVVLSQKNILSNVSQILNVYPDKRASMILGILPLSHAYQQTLGLFTPLALGSTIVFLKVTNSVDLLKTIKKYKITLIPLVPRVLELIHSSITRKIRNKRTRSLLVKVISVSRFLPRQLRRLLFFFVHKEIGTSLTTFVSGGAPINPNIEHFFQGLGYKVMVGYGLSECAPIVCAHFGQSRQVGEIGKPLPGVSVTLAKDGEIQVTGDNVFLGYWPEHKQESQTHHTGDLAHQTRNGSLVLKGRSKNLIVFNSGEKCFCEDLELIIGELELVELVCVIEKNRNGNVMAECVIAIKQGESLKEKEVQNYIAKKLPLGINVTRCLIVPDIEFPVTHTLKPNRAAISKLLD